MYTVRQLAVKRVATIVPTKRVPILRNNVFANI